MNHLLIGLGDTGGVIIDEFNRLLTQNKLSHLSNSNPNNGYLGNKNQSIAVDSLWLNAKIGDLNARQSTDSIAEKPVVDSIQITPEKTFTLQTNNFQQLYLKLKPLDYQPEQRLNEWLNDEAWFSMLQENTADSLLSKQNKKNPTHLTKRPMTRLLFSEYIDDFIDRIKQIISQLRHTSSTREVCFHVIANLSDGISSGLIIDVLAQLRKNFPVTLDGVTPSTDRYAILAYTYLPDNPPVGWSHKNYHANAYACLLELNALSIGRWQPYDISRLEVASNPYHPFNLIEEGTSSVRLPAHNLSQVFNNCYIFSDKHAQTKHNTEDDEQKSEQSKNTSDYHLSIENEVPKLVAEFILQKNIVPHRENSQAWSLLHDIEQTDIRFNSMDLESHELFKNQFFSNLSQINPSKSSSFVPEFEHGKPARSIRFMNFGISRLEYPEDLLHQSLSYKYQQQALSQLRFNNWKEGKGYIDYLHTSAKKKKYLDIISSDYAQQTWKIDNDFLILDKPIMDEAGSSKWQPHDMTWLAYSQHYQHIVSGGKVGDWLDQLYDMIHHCYQEQYRGVGVPKLFEQATENKHLYAQHIKDLVEQHLLQQLKFGSSSLFESGNILSALKLHLDSRLAKSITQANAYYNRAKQYFDNYTAINASWKTKYGGIIKTKDETEDWDIAASNLQGHYTCLTYQQAYSFQSELLTELLAVLSSLQNQINDCNLLFSKMFKIAKNAGTSDTMAKILDYESTNTDSDNEPVSPVQDNAYVYILSNEQMQTTYRELLTHRDIQDTNTETARNVLFETLGSTPSFQKILDNRTLINERLYDNAYQQVSESHRLYVSEENKILDISIIDRLYTIHLDDTEGLKSQLHRLIDAAGSFAGTNSYSRSDIDNDISSYDTDEEDDEQKLLEPANSTAVFIPKLPEQSTTEQHIFFKKIKSAVHQYQQKHPKTKITIIETEDQGREASVDSDDVISVISINYGFPLHAFELLEKIKEGYKKRLIHNVSSAHELHLEGDGSYLFRLSPIATSEVRSLFKPVILLAIYYGFLQKQTMTNPASTKSSDKDIQWIQVKHPQYKNIEERDYQVWGHSLLEVVQNITDNQIVFMRDQIQPLLTKSVPYDVEETEALLAVIRPEIVKIRHQVESLYPAQSTYALSTIESWNIAFRQIVKIIKGREHLET